MMSAGNGQLTVPPGFRFHPTDEELLYYYLRKKVSYEAIDLDVIREVDLNKLEPWDLKEKCRIGSGPQNEWYFFSHKDKKYPTGTRTNRATTAGFWKATGRDKAIHLSDSKRIGMRKTLVFYTGRAPHGQKTDWIMHEYRLEDHHDNLNVHEVQEDGWVVCRVFKKKNHINRGYQQDFGHHQEVEHDLITQMKATGNSHAQLVLDHHHHHHQPKQNIHHHHLEASIYDHYPSTFDGSMHLPQLFSQESAAVAAAAAANSSSFSSPPPNQHNMSAAGGGLNPLDLECSQNLLKLTSTAGGTCGLNMHQQQQQDMRSFNGDWSFLDKLLSSHHPQAQAPQQDHHHVATTSSATQRLFPFQYLGGSGGGGSITTHVDLLKFSK